MNPSRAQLAAQLKTLGRNPSFAMWARQRPTLVQYVDIAEDTIREQANMLAADAAELANRNRVRRELVDSIDGLVQDIARLEAQNTALRELVIEAMRITNAPLAMWAIGAGVMPRESACIIAACLLGQVNLNPVAHAEMAANGKDLTQLLGDQSPSDLVDLCTKMVRIGALTSAGWAPGFLDALREDIGRSHA